LNGLSKVYVLAAFVFAAHCSYVAARYHWTVPYVDDWRILADMFSQPLSSWIFADQSGHRIPVTLLLTFLDYTFFGARMHLLVFASVVCLWISAAVLYLGLAPEGMVRGPIDHLRFGFCVFCLFWAASSFDLAWGMNQGTQLGILWTCVSLAALAAYQRRRQASGGAAGRSLPGAAGIASLLATFSHGAGSATWAALNSAALAARLPWRIVTGFVGASLATIAIYGTGLSVVQSSLNAYRARLSSAPGRVFDFVAAFTGAPVAHVNRALDDEANRNLLADSTVVGKVAVVTFLALFVYSILRRATCRAEQIVPIGMMALTVAGGLLVSLNRLPFPSTAVSERFLSWATPFWVGAVCVLVRFCSRSNGAGWFALLLVVLLSSAMFASLDTFRREQDHTAFRLDMEAAMHQVDVRWDGFGRMFTDVEQVYSVVDRMRRDRRGFLADRRAALVGEPFNRHFDVAPAAACDARLVRGQWLKARNTKAAMLYGYVGKRDRPLAFALFTDGLGVICGLGAVERRPAPKAVAGNRPEPAATVWTGFLNARSHPAPYGVFLVLAGEREACRIATWGGGA
jgi:hypothetical protein